MSFNTWHTYGYGVKVSDVKLDSVDRFKALLKLAPELEKNIEQWCAENSIEISSVEDYFGYDECCHELATIMKENLMETEGIEFTDCDDFDGDIYLLYEPTYPWYLTDKDKGLTEEKIEKILIKYFSIITDDPLEVGYYDPENGG